MLTIPEQPTNSGKIIITPNFEVLRAVLGERAKLRAFLLWKLVPRPGTPKFDKQPINPESGEPERPNSAEARAVLTLDEAEAAIRKLAKRGMERGLGCLPKRLGLAGLDFDDVVLTTGKLMGWALPATQCSYAEMSPSGQGYRVLIENPPACFEEISNGLERGSFGVYGTKAKKFLTLTGAGAVRPIGEIPLEVAEALRERWRVAGVRQWTPGERGDGYPRGAEGLEVALEDVVSGAALHPAIMAAAVRAARLMPLDEARQLVQGAFDQSRARIEEPERWTARATSVERAFAWVVERGGYRAESISDEKRAQVKAVVISFKAAREKLEQQARDTVIEAEDFDPEDIGVGPWTLPGTIFADPVEMTEHEAREIQIMLGCRWQYMGKDGRLMLEVMREDAGAQAARDERFPSDPVDLWGNFEPPELPRGLLPQVIEDYARAQGEMKGVEAGAFAMAALAASAAAIPDSVCVKVKRHDNWTESARIWVLLVGPPSARKSPVINTVIRPLVSLNENAIRHNNAEWRAWDALDKEDKARTPEPRKTRLILNDATVEATHEIFAGSPNGVILIQHEMTKFLGDMDRYRGGKGGDRGYWLQTYDGGSYAVERIKRGSVHISNLSASMLGAVQPEPIRKLTAESVDDGLIQRMLPVLMAPAGDDQDIPAGTESEAYHEAVACLFHIEMPEDVEALRFDDRAQAIRHAVAKEHAEFQALEQISPKLASHIGKYDGLFARLCVIWHCAEYIQNKRRPVNLPTTITGRTAERVADFMRQFILPQALAFYGGTLDLSGNSDLMEAVAAHILTKRLERVTMRGLSTSIRALRKVDSKTAEAVMDNLARFGWIAKSEAVRSDSVAWDVNPTVHDLFAERALIEAARLEAAQKAMSRAFTQRRKAK
ncbi:DUF3987 domain-containing protein [Paracoccus ravus]|uniref:DUF3987 domain-containing protein n=1 Tax=Paracoccus ravus TaxID=2447760 RepID=UPI00106E1DAB|nr:DUF3987 domain-containing protein [Paracoccus ravus]